jgi:hypothetical protein
LDFKQEIQIQIHSGFHWIVQQFSTRRLVVHDMKRVDISRCRQEFLLDTSARLDPDYLQLPPNQLDPRVPCESALSKVNSKRRPLGVGLGWAVREVR